MRKIILPREIVEMYEGGMSARQIGEQYGCTGSTVGERLKEFGVRMRTQTSTPHTREWNQKLSESHLRLWDRIGRPGAKPDLLQRSAWKQRRLECYERDGWTCQHCGERCTNRNGANPKRWIQAHHIKARRDGGGDELENLVTLCMECHHREERRLRPSLPNLIATRTEEYLSEFSFKVKEEQTHGIIEGVTG